MSLWAERDETSDKRSNFGEGASSDRLTSNRKSTTLIVCQPEPPVPKLLPEDSVLLAEILYDRILLSGDPAGQGGNEDLPRLKNNGHLSIVANSTTNRQLSRPSELGYSSQETRRLSNWTLRATLACVDLCLAHGPVRSLLDRFAQCLKVLIKIRPH